MKKYFILIAALAFAAISCDKNESPSFDDSNAYVAFNTGTISVSELNNTVSIPVTLVSLGGLETVISYEAVDGTAKAGTNYELADGAATLTFTKDEPTQYIVINILDPGATYAEEEGQQVRQGGLYTGDLKFTVELEPTQNVSVGYQSTCTVTVGDVDHPMTPLLGTYTCNSSRGAYENPWTMEIFKDEDDDHLVWIDNIFGNSGWSAPSTRFYGNVSDDMTTLVVPYGQDSEYMYPYGDGVPLTLYWSTANYDGSAEESDSDDYSEHGKTGSNIATIHRDDNGNVTKIVFDEEHGFVAFLETLGWAAFAKPQITATKN